jgi:hypothetical protein
MSFMLFYLRSRGRVSSILTTLSQAVGSTTERSWFDSRQEKFSGSKLARLFQWFRHSLVKCVPVALCRGLGRQSDRAVNLSTHALCQCSYTCASPYDFMTRTRTTLPFSNLRGQYSCMSFFKRFISDKVCTSRSKESNKIVP